MESDFAVANDEEEGFLDNRDQAHKLARQYVWYHSYSTHGNRSVLRTMGEASHSLPSFFNTRGIRTTGLAPIPAEALLACARKGLHMDCC